MSRTARGSNDLRSASASSAVARRDLLGRVPKLRERCRRIATSLVRSTARRRQGKRLRASPGYRLRSHGQPNAACRGVQCRVALAQGRDVLWTTDVDPPPGLLASGEGSIRSAPRAASLVRSVGSSPFSAGRRYVPANSTARCCPRRHGRVFASRRLHGNSRCSSVLRQRELRQRVSALRHEVSAVGSTQACGVSSLQHARGRIRLPRFRRACPRQQRQAGPGAARAKHRKPAMS